MFALSLSARFTIISVNVDQFNMQVSLLDSDVNLVSTSTSD